MKTINGSLVVDEAGLFIADGQGANLSTLALPTAGIRTSWARFASDGAGSVAATTIIALVGAQTAVIYGSTLMGSHTDDDRGFLNLRSDTTTTDLGSVGDAQGGLQQATWSTDPGEDVEFIATATLKVNADYVLGVTYRVVD